MNRKEQHTAPRFRLAYLPVILLAVLSLLWMLLNLHPDAGVAVSARDGSLDTLGRLDVYLNNAKADALENVTFIKRIYTIPENDLSGPKPDESKFGVTDDPMVVQAVVESAAELLDGQELIWNPDIELMPGSSIHYYCDDTILVIAWKEAHGGTGCNFAEVRIAHGSQLRRFIAGNSYGSSVELTASSMAKSANAVVAINGDFYGYRQLGITVYQRQLYRNVPKNVDSCFFTAGGDMLFSHKGELMGEGEAQKFIEDNDVVFSIAFGPILVENGELQTTTVYPIGEIDKHYSRSVIAQVDQLHYLLMTVNHEGSYTSVATLAEAASIIYDKGVKSAYTLDGGQTAVLYMDGGPINHVDWGAERTMSDIIYFATALPEEEVRP